MGTMTGTMQYARLDPPNPSRAGETNDITKAFISVGDEVALLGSATRSCLPDNTPEVPLCPHILIATFIGHRKALNYGRDARRRDQRCAGEGQIDS